MDDLTKEMGNGCRTLRSAEEWREIFSEFTQSGQTREQFCSERNLKLSTFSRWRKRLRGSVAVASEQDNGDGLFVALSPEPAKPNMLPWDAELELGGGVVLRLRRGAC